MANYVTSDGKTFENQMDAINHQKQINLTDKSKKLVYYTRGYKIEVKY